MTIKTNFQTIIINLQNYWAAHGCLIWQPYYTQVGAGTMNPATFLRVLGPEAWNVAYVEPAVRPDDGRYGENPNRFQMHYQYQVILKPDPGNPQELYLDSLKAIGIDPRQHDIRFIEDNWEQPAISAWGLGWEVRLDGQEITQFTYFQQMGGISLDPVSVELTYGLERILIALNNAQSIWNEPWAPGVTYGEIRQREEYEHSKYYFDTADVAAVRKMYDLYRAEAEASLTQGLVLPAHDYVLKCSHAFNLLDTRGAIGVTERQAFFGQMRELARRVAEAYLDQRKKLDYPLLKTTEEKRPEKQAADSQASIEKTAGQYPDSPAAFLLEIGVEELPVSDLKHTVDLLKIQVQSLFDTYKLAYGSIESYGTPRRLTIYVTDMAPRQDDDRVEVKGPPEHSAFDSNGNPTKAAYGWAKKNGLPSDDKLFLQGLVRDFPDGRYLQFKRAVPGKPAIEVFKEFLLIRLISEIKFDKSMRWNTSNVTFARPIRWIVALFGETVIPFEYAGLISGHVTRGLRPYGSPEIEIPSAEKYLDLMKKNDIILDVEQRKALIVKDVKKLAASLGGEAVLPKELLSEVANLVEKPTPVLGSINPDFLTLPREVLISVMQKHQYYFPLEKNGKLMPNFITVCNGNNENLDLIRQGNEHVLGARFADADFFVREDLKHKLEDFRPRLSTLIFQAKLGSMLDRSERIEKLVKSLTPMLNLHAEQAAFACRAAHLCKTDLVTKMVVEMTSLQGIIGREYALRSGEHASVADAVGELYQPIPQTQIGLAVALADRLDALTGLFAAGLIPTGAKDPFALRRAAIGILQPLIDHHIPFDLQKATQTAASLQPIKTSDETIRQVLDFLAGRLRVILIDASFHYDIVDAILAEQSNNPDGAEQAVRQLTVWISRKDWTMILPAFARCVRITRDQKIHHPVDPTALIEKTEKELFAEIQKAEKMPRAAGSVQDFLNAFTPMILVVNRFFEDVLVMTEDKKIQQNRLGLLQRISALSTGVADLSKLEGF